MNQSSMVVGLDVHKEKITAAVLPPRATRPTEVLTIENHPKAIVRLVKRLANRGPSIFVYEAGPCGYEVQRQITQIGHTAAVIAPALVPRRPGDRVKTNRRDAEKLVRVYRAGELTEIRVPTRAEEAARDLVCVREDALKDRLRARHRLSKFLLRQGRAHHETKGWGAVHRAWLRAQRFAAPLLQSTFEAYLHALEDAEGRLETLDQQVLALSQTACDRVPVQYLRCLKGIDTLGATARARMHVAAPSRKPGMRICVAFGSRPRGATATATRPAPSSGSGAKVFRPKSSGSPGGHKIGCTASSGVF